jgi:hypothetical protein
MLIMRFIFCGMLLMWAANSHPVGRQEPWPHIAPLLSAYNFRDLVPGKDTPVVEILKDVGGVPRYRLECHNGNYDGESIISFSGTLHCAVVAIAGKIISGNLLAEAIPAQQRSDWLNRGRFLATQLRKPCSAYREYGTDRTFRFRGLKLTLRLRDIEWSQGSQPTPTRPTGFTLDIAASYDAAATTATADRTSLPAPPSECF